MAFLDYVIMVVYLLAVVGIGWHFSKNENSTDDYLLGDKQINILLFLSIPIVIVASWFLYYNVAFENRIFFTITGSLGVIFVLLGGYGCAIFSKRQPNENMDGFTFFTLKELSNETKAGTGEIA
jgi:magnesium-transporting ATPase (P-type)